jgi:hypothetical protein
MQLMKRGSIRGRGKDFSPLQRFIELNNVVSP